MNAENKTIPDLGAAENAAVIETALAHCTGGGDMYQHWTGRMKYTTGISTMAELCGAHWLIDLVASYQTEPVIRKDPRLQEFQLWTLKVDRSVEGQTSAAAVCRRDSGDGEPEIIRQEIEYTDFPLDKITLYVEGDVLLLPREH